MKRAGEKIGNLLPELAKYLGLSTHISQYFPVDMTLNLLFFGSGAKYDNLF